MSTNTRDSRARPVLDLGARIVERVEQAICGRHVVPTAAAAEGLALAGVRAAAVSFGARVLGGRADEALAYVVHSDRFEEGPPLGPVVLIAGSHQAAADQCLIAHTLSAALRCRVDALVDPRVVNSFGQAFPASSEQIAALLGDGSTGLEDAPPDESIEACVLRGFARVESILGRACGPIRIEGSAPKATLLTAGFPGGLLSPLTRAAGRRMHHLSMGLLRPLPWSALVAAITPGKPLVGLIPAKSALHLEALHRLTEAAATGRLGASEVRGLEIDREIGSSDDLLAYLREALPADLGKLFVGASASSGEESIGVRIGVVPGRPFEESLLLECGAGLVPPEGASSDFRLVRHSREFISLEMGRPGEGVDLLLLRSGRSVDPTAGVRALRPEGAVLLGGEGGEPLAAWGRLPHSARVDLLDRKVKVWWLDAPLESGPGSVAAALGRILGGLGDKSSRHWGSGPETPAEVALRELDGVTLEAAMERATPLVAIELPRIAVESADPSDARDWTTWIREFHLTGRKPWATDSGADLFPAALMDGDDEEVGSNGFPLLVPEPTAIGRPEPLLAVLERLCGELGEASVLRRLLPSLAGLADGAARTENRLPALFDAALERLTQGADLSEAGRKRLAEEMGELRPRLPERGEVAPLAPGAWWKLYRWGMDRALESRRASFAGEIEKLAGELEAILAVDRGLQPESRSPDFLRASLGEGGLPHVDPEKLAVVFPRRRGSSPLGDERRSRIERTLANLRSFLGSWRHGPRVYLVHSGLFGVGELDAGTKSIVHPAPFELASGLFSGLADELVEAAGAIRTARLEATGDFDPDRHQPMIDRLNWESLSLDELAILPRIVVIESSSRLTVVGLTDFHRLLSSGRPVQVLVRLDDAAPAGREWSGLPPDLAYLGMAHREVFILQSGLGDWSHLLEGFQQLFEVPGPAVVLMALPDEAESPSHSRARWTALRDSRSVPLCRYDPRKGVSWAERLSLEGNPQPDRPAVGRVIRHLDEEGMETATEETCTFAHAAALDPRFAPHFLAIPRAAWGPDQVPVSRYLEEYVELPPETLPFIWMIDGRGVLRRAVITRELAHVCRDRSRAWKVLQELAGWNNPHVERAVESARREVLAEAESQIRDSRDAAREEGAREAVERLVALLANPELAAGIAPPAPVAAAPGMTALAAPAAVEEPKAPTAAAEVAEEEPDVVAEPYIDSFLCTSCNDCINLNPRLFKYNQDKQAFIADPAAGTYRELVKAAEVCPAKCIHPGAPRPGDETATPEVMERAKAFL